MSDLQIDPSPVEEPPVKLTPQEQYALAIMDELTNDPMGLGYKGKSPEEQTELLNNTWYLMVPQAQTPRIAILISQIAFAPNAVTADEISQAQANEATLRAKLVK